jgi:hypothetical protein
MKSFRIVVLISLLITCQLVTGQQTGGNWDKWKHLIGEWVGEGTGRPGENQGKFSFQTDLDGMILVRKNHTVFPATADSPVKVHDDLLIVYPGAKEGPQEAIYFDNEGNTINYKVSFTENSVILTSEATRNAPGFRLSYMTIDNKTVNITFEIASMQDPKVYKMYLSGKAFKVK